MYFLISTGIRLLEFLFFAGWIGSLIVILLSGVEDVETIFSKDSGSSPPPMPPVSAVPAQDRG